MTVGLAEDRLANLAERHAAERAMVRDALRRYDWAAVAAAKSPAVLNEADARRAVVLVEWVAMPGWSVEPVAQCSGLRAREVSDSIRSRASSKARRRDQSSR